MSPTHDPTQKGYHNVYKAGEVNHCPGCGRTHWIIGRQSAECAFCTTAVPLEEPAPSSQATILSFSSRSNYTDLKGK
jgi:hypothetical protein